MDKFLRLLYVEDDVDNQKDLKDVLSGRKVNDYSIIVDCESSFEDAIEKSQRYHIVILDLYKGPAIKGGEDAGSKVFEKVRNAFFVPIIFYSGNIGVIKDLKSQVVGVASKGGDVDELISEIERLTRHNLPFLKERIHECIEDEFRKYFWDVIQEQSDKFIPDANDFSLGYMLLRNFADSLSKENIKRIVCDESIKEDKVHPMEFYIYPMNKKKEYECGEIVRRKSNNDICVILTPSCDFVKRSDGKRKADNILLANTILLTSTQEYAKFMGVKKEYNQIAEYEDMLRKAKDENEERDLNNKIKKVQNSISNLKSSFTQFINSGKSDRYFFLPGTPFIDNRVVDFQKQEIVSFSSLRDDFERVAKLDNPFAQSMISSFIRYYDRIGFPDIDAEYVMNHL